MVLFFFINFLNIVITSSTYQNQELHYYRHENTSSHLELYGLYVLFKECELKQKFDILYNELDGEYIELDFFLKTYLILNQLIYENGGFYDLNDYICKYKFIRIEVIKELKELLTEKEKEIYRRFKNSLSEHFNIDDLDFLDFKDLFYISSYINQIDDLDLLGYILWMKFFKGEDESGFKEFIDMLDVEDDIRTDILAGKSKKNYLIDENEIKTKFKNAAEKIRKYLIISDQELSERYNN